MAADIGTASTNFDVNLSIASKESNAIFNALNNMMLKIMTTVYDMMHPDGIELDKQAIYKILEVKQQGGAFNIPVFGNLNFPSNNFNFKQDFIDIFYNFVMVEQPWIGYFLIGMCVLILYKIIRIFI